MRGSIMIGRNLQNTDVSEMLMIHLIKVIHYVNSVMNDFLTMMNSLDICGKTITSVISVMRME